MMQLVDAVCLWGESKTAAERAAEILRTTYPQCAEHLFTCSLSDRWSALWRANALKRDSEVARNSLYKGVLYVHCDYAESAISRDYPRIAAQHTVHYVYGIHEHYTVGTGVAPWIIYCDSLSGDLVSQYKWNVHATERTEYDFYFHLKSYRLRTNCLNPHDNTCFVVTAR